MSIEFWHDWNRQGGPKYPHEKVIQFCFRTYPPARRPSVRTLDLGCGGGVHTVFLVAEGFAVTATDLSQEGVAQTLKKLRSQGLSADVRVQSADVLDFPDASFDLVICVGVYEASGPAVAKSSVQRLRHVLAAGARGLFLFASDRDYRLQGENSPSLHGYSRDEVEDVFAGEFARVWIDRYVTTYQGGQLEQNDWLVTLEK